MKRWIVWLAAMALLIVPVAGCPGEAAGGPPQIEKNDGGALSPYADGDSSADGNGGPSSHVGGPAGHEPSEPDPASDAGTGAGTDAETDSGAGAKTDAETGAETAAGSGAEPSLHNLDIAQRDVDRFLDLMRRGEARELVALVNETWLTQEHEAAAMIEGFARIFDLASLTAEPASEGTVSWDGGGSYEFRLTDGAGGGNGGEQVLVIVYDLEGRPAFKHPFIRYYPHAESLVDGYLDLIRREEAEKLASCLNADDLEVPVWVAEETIRRYREQFGDREWTVAHVRPFEFTVSDDRGNSHGIRVKYGDGLMGIEDEWIPDFQ